ncbi:response regulator transcription factor [Serratia nevei]|uniref:response regulator transcription factor n=1 Tax=Serratia nevei TaxID=2703794 RepID=UPI00356701A8
MAILLDAQLSGINGYQILARIRRKSVVPIIMLTVTGEIQNKNTSLRHGIDDYIARSYNLEEVVARVHAVLRRTTAPNIKSVLITCGQVQLDENAILAQIYYADDIKPPLSLTPTEFL